MPDFIDHQPNALHNARYSRVSINDALVTAEEWNVVEGLYVIELREDVAPDVGYCRMMWHAGFYTRWFDGELNVKKKPLSLERVYVKVEMLQPPDETETSLDPTAAAIDEPIVEYTWFGTIEVDELEDLLAGGNPPKTNQILTAYDLKRDLENTIVDSAVLANLDADDVVRIGRGLTFNPSGYDEQSDLGNQYKAPIDTDAGNTWVFQNRRWDPRTDDAADQPQRWDAYTAIDHLLTHHAPVQSGSSERELTCTWTLAGLDDPLGPTHPLRLVSWYDVADVRTDRRSLKNIIDDLVDRRRFVGWYVSGDDSGEEFVATVHVFSFSDRDIELEGDEEIAANPDQVQLNLANVPEVQELPVINNATQRYDEVVVEGEYITSTFTATLIDPPNDEDIGLRLVPGWSQEDEDAYLTAASESAGYDDLSEEEQAELNTAFRSDDRFRDVFSRFVVFDELLETQQLGGEGPVTLTDEALDELTEDNISETFENADSPGNQWISGARLLPMLPFVNDPERPWFREGEPYLLVGIGNGERDIWRYGEQLNADGNRNWSLGLEMLPDAFGVRITVGQAGGQQLIAKDTFANGSPAATPEHLDPAITENGAIQFDDYILDEEQSSMVVVVAMNWDRRVSQRVNLSPPNFTAAKRTRRIYVPNARLDIVCPKTTGSITDSGGITYLSQNGAILRDDRPRLKAIAQAAAQWYGVRRQAVSIAYGKLTLKLRPPTLEDPAEGANQPQIPTLNPEPLSLGTLITKIANNVSRPDVNCPITSIRFNVPEQQTVIQTTFFEGDFV
ncbi:hypothetical protein GYB59_00525 [bacterium]|nr:hypothetical protein [bacterium]